MRAGVRYNPRTKAMVNQVASRVVTFIEIMGDIGKSLM